MAISARVELTTMAISDPNIVVAYFKQGNFYATGDKDNLTNFSDKTLGDAIPK